ncbi:hypothetical protein VTO73DRAFT_2701 [Trametes versicolor]
MSSTSSSSSGGPCTTRAFTPPFHFADFEVDKAAIIESTPPPPKPSRSALFSKPAVEAVFLVDASPVLEAMCNAAAPALAVDLSETSDVAETLLELCHPLASDPHFPSFDASKPAILLGWKYELRGRAHERVRRILEVWLGEEPVRVYVFAVQNDRPELLEEAARACLLREDVLADHEELDAISTRTYRRLVAYREACMVKMTLLASDTTKDGPDRRSSSGLWVWKKCNCLRKVDYKEYDIEYRLERAEWFDAFYVRLVETLRATPHPDAIRGNRFEHQVRNALKSAARCPSDNVCYSSRCGEDAGKDLRSFLVEIAHRVELWISEAVLAPLKWHLGRVAAIRIGRGSPIHFPPICAAAAQSCVEATASVEEPCSSNGTLLTLPQQHSHHKASSGPCTTRASTPVSDSRSPELEPETVNSKSPPPRPLRSSLFSRPAVEVAVRSADGAEFYVPRQFLVDASPVLESMCNICPSAPSTVSIDLPETSDMVETLLELCYPFAFDPARVSADFDALKPLLRMCWKYKLRGAARACVQAALVPLLAQEPLRVYVLAAQLDEPELMQVAARAYLRHEDALVDAPELDAISTRTYWRLLLYRLACVDAIVGNLPGSVEEVYTAFGREWAWVNCSACLQRARLGFRRIPWFYGYYDHVWDTLTKTPHPDKLREEAMRLEGVAQASANCKTCASYAVMEVSRFLELLVPEVERLISKVKLDGLECYTLAS